MEKKSLLNTYVNDVSMGEAIDHICDLIEEKKKSYIVAINVDVVVKIENDPYLKEITDNADMVIVDGKPLIWISKIHKRPIKSKISGSDLVPALCEVAAKNDYKVFFLGGQEGVAEVAKTNLEAKYPGIKIVGTYAPDFGFEKKQAELDKINEMINSCSPDILVACFGCPKQEKWIYENYQKYNATVSVCAGATVDFLAGRVKRAPKWVSEMGFEWLYRFFQEPKRMYKRYFVDDMLIFKLIKKYK